MSLWPAAATKAEFLAGLRAGHGVVRGESGDYWKLTRDVLYICSQMFQENKWTVLLAPLAAGVPAAILVNYCVEVVFARKWFGRVLQTRPDNVVGSWAPGKVSA